MQLPTTHPMAIRRGLKPSINMKRSIKASRDFEEGVHDFSYLCKYVLG